MVQSPSASTRCCYTLPLLHIVTDFKSPSPPSFLFQIATLYVPPLVSDGFLLLLVSLVLFLASRRADSWAGHTYWFANWIRSMLFFLVAGSPAAAAPSPAAAAPSPAAAARSAVPVYTYSR